MNIPLLTTAIGSSFENENKNEYSYIIKTISNIKNEDNPFVVYLIFDIDNGSIYFKLEGPYTEDSCYKYYYFGNNSAATAQFYMTRDIKYLYYLLKSSFSDLYNCLIKNNMEKCELIQLLKLLQEKDLIKLNKAKGQGSVNLNKIKGYEQENIILDYKNLIIKGKKVSFDNFIRGFINNNNKNNKFVMAIPAIIRNKNVIIVSQHKDYLNFVKKALNLENDDKSSKKGEKVCYICGENKANVDSKYSTKFSRVNINKIFTTTTKNYSQINKNLKYDDNYSFCQSCYKKLALGSKIINEKFVGRIAGESAFILPEAICGKFDYTKAYKLKSDVDLAFNQPKLNDLIVSTEDSSVFDKVDYYSLNFIVYRTDGNSIDLIEAIEDIPEFRIKKIIKSLSNNSIKYGQKLNVMHLSDIYRIIPVRENKKMVQLNIERVLSLYKSLLCGEIIDKENIYSYADEAIEKGCKQLDKKLIDNYKNMNLQYYKQNDLKDYFIRNITMKYIALFKTLQELEILNKNVFDEERERKMNIINTASEEVNNRINKVEEFLSLQKFTKEAKSMFYLGMLINEVAYQQYNHKHKNKPILKKIQFQGMKIPEICRLYADVINKLKQYNAVDLFSEAYMNRFHIYSGILDKNNWPLSDQANVFYIMAGYSYMVGNIPEKKTENKENGGN